MKKKSTHIPKNVLGRLECSLNHAYELAYELIEKNYPKNNCPNKEVLVNLHLQIGLALANFSILKEHLKQE